MNEYNGPNQDLLEKDKRSGEDTYEFWKATIEGAFRFRNDTNKCIHGPESWELDIKQYQGYDPFFPKGDLIIVNETGAAVQTFHAFLMHHNPKFQCEPRHYEDTVSCMIQEDLINYCWREYSMQEQLEKAGLDSCIYGIGFIRDGWSFEQDFAVKNPKKQGRIGTKDYQRPGSPWIRRVAPHNILLDPEAPEYDIESARWIGEKYWVPLYEIYNSDDPTINSKVVEELRDGKGRGSFADAFYVTERNRRMRNLEPVNTDRVQVIEIWDKRFLKWYQFIPGILEPLRESNWPYADAATGQSYLDGLPYTAIPFFQNPDQLYPFGIPRWIRHQQHELNRSRTQMFEYRRRVTNIMFTVVTNALASDKELDTLMRGEMGEYIRARVHNAVQAIEVPPLPPDLYNIEAKLMMDIERILGLDELARSGRLPSRTSAHEINARTNLLTLKTRPRKTAFDRAATKIARHILQHEKAQASGERVIKIAGKLGQYWDAIKAGSGTDMSAYAEKLVEAPDKSRYIKFTAEDIQAEFDLDVQSMSMGDYDPDMKRAALNQLIQQTIPQLPILAQFFQQVPDVPEMFKKFCEEYDIRDAARMLPWVATPPANTTIGGNTPEGGQAPQTQQQQVFQQGVSPNSALAGSTYGGQQ